MTTATEVREQISTAQSLIAEQESAITQSRAEAERQRLEVLNTETKLRENLSKLPQATQQRLRQQIFAGLEGRKRLQLVKGAESQLQSGLGQIQEFKGGLSQYEQGLSEYEQNVLNPYREQVSQAQLSLTQYDQSVSDYNYGWQLGMQGTVDPGFNQTQRQGYLDALERIEYAQGVQQFNAQLSELQAQGITPIFNSAGRMTGYEDSNAGTSVAYDIPGLAIPQPNMTFAPPRDLPRDVIIKDFPKINTVSGFGIVSAQDLTSRTTGSPLKFQSLNNASTPREQALQMSIPTAERYLPPMTLAPPKPGFIQKIGDFSRSSLVSGAEKIKEGINYLSKAGSEGNKDIFKRLNVPLEYQNKQAREVNPYIARFTGQTQSRIPLESYSKTPAGLLVDVSKFAPSLLFFIPEASADVVLGLNQRRPEEIEKTKQSQINIMDTEQRQQTLLPEYRFATREEIAQQYGGDIEGSIKSQAKTQLIYGGLVLASVGLIKGGQKLFKPIVSREGGKIVEPVKGFQARSYAYTAPVYDKTIEGSTTEVLRSPVIEKKTNLFKKIFDISPTSRIVYPEKINIVESYGEKGMIQTSERYKIGKKNVKGISNFEFVTGKQGEILSAEQVAKLGGTPEFLLERLQVIKTGGKVPKEMIPKMFSEEESFVLGEQTSLDLIKAAGKRTVTTQTLMKVKQIKELPMGVKLYQFEAVGKDISKPFSRRVGTTPAVYGTYLQFPTPIKEAEEMGVKILSPANIKKTPMSKTFPILKEVPNIKLVFHKPVKSPSVLIKETGKSKGMFAVTQIPRIESAYAGKGTYERTTDLNIINPFISNGKSNVVSGIRTGSSSGEFFRDTDSRFSSGFREGLMGQDTSQVGAATLSDLSTRTETGQNIQSGLGEIQDTRLISIQRVNQPQLVPSKEKSKLKEILIIKPIQKEIQQLEQPQKTIQEQIVTPRITQTPRNPPKPPKRPTPKEFVDFFEKRKKKKIENELTNEAMFEPFVYVKGSPISLGKFSSEKKAQEELFRKIRGEIRASGFLERQGKKIKINAGGTEFTSAKGDEFRIVEPKERRIKRGTAEVSQLKQAKRQAQKVRWL